MDETPRLSIIMPCLNEARTLGSCIRKAQGFLQASRLAGEIIVADNGSSDGSQEIAARLGARLVEVPERGYGSALMAGIEAARSDLVVMGDSDDSYDFEHLEPFVTALEQGYDLVMGNRFKGGIRPGAMPFLHRHVGNPLLSGIARLFFKSGIGDYHCGLRAFRRQAILGLNLRTRGMEFASEMVVKATLYGLRLTEVPVILYPDGRGRPSHLRTWSDGWRHLKFLLLYSPRWLFLFPGALLTGLGLGLGALLLGGPLHLGRVTLDINTLMYAALMVLVGVQGILFSLFTYVYGVRANLLPADARTEKALERFGLEQGILLGTAMILAGSASSVGALVYWGSNAFGPIEPTVSMRLVIPGAVLFALGFQILFASFFLGIVNTKLK